MREPGRHHDTKRADFEATALPWLDPLHRLASRLAPQPADAADLVQETFLRAYRTFDNFQPGTNARAWLFTIMYSIVINLQKQQSRRGVVVPIEDADLEDAGTFVVAEADDRIAHVEVSDGVHVGPEVDEALREIPADYRAAVLLVDAHEMTYEEAAAVLQCPVGTVRSRLFRGRRLLAKLLRAHAERSGFPGGDR